MAPTYEAVHTTGAPQPLPQFSQAVKYNGMVYLSGNIGAVPGKAFELVQGTVKDRAVSNSHTLPLVTPATPFGHPPGQH